MRPRAGKLLERRHDVERGGVAIGILALRQRPRLLALRAAGDEGDQLEQRVGRRRQRDVVDQHLAQRLAVDLGGVGGAEQRDDLIDEADLVAREHAKAVADDIVELALGEIELDVIGLLLRLPLLSRRRDRNVAAIGLSRERPGSAIVTVTAGAATASTLSAALAAGALSSSSYSDFSIRAVSLPPGTQRLSRASLRLAIASE